jgi:hypothetical protein
MSKKTTAWDDEESHKNKKLLTPDQSSLIVKIIEDDSNMLHETLGITQEDSRRIQDIIFSHLKADAARGVSKSNTSALLVKLSEECKHANQLAFGCFALGKITAEHARPDPFGNSRVGAIGVNRKTGEVKHFGEDGDMPDFIKDILRDLLRGKGNPDDKDL